MPRYFFDIDDGLRRSVDENGLELTGPWEARELVVSAIPDIVQDIHLDEDRRDIVSCVKDEHGNLVYTAKLSLVGEWKIDPPPRLGGSSGDRHIGHSSPS